MNNFLEYFILLYIESNINLSAFCLKSGLFSRRRKNSTNFFEHKTNPRLLLQEERLMKMSAEYGTRLESLTSDLLLFESRLSRKQRAIGELLDQREYIIERQQHAIQCLHSRLADFGVTMTGTRGCGVGGGGAGGPTSDDGNVDDSDSAVIMEEDESGNSQEDASEQIPEGVTMDGRREPPESLMTEDGRETDGRGENVTATTYNRVMSNHRSVTKPKDVKYKRINKAKSKSLEELRGRLKNWVDRGQRMSLTVDPTFGWPWPRPTFSGLLDRLRPTRKRTGPWTTMIRRWRVIVENESDMRS